MHFHIAPANGLENSSGVERGLIERSVPMDRGYTKEINSRVLRAEEESVGVLGVGDERSSGRAMHVARLTSCPVSFAMPLVRSNREDTDGYGRNRARGVSLKKCQPWLCVGVHWIKNSEWNGLHNVCRHGATGKCRVHCGGPALVWLTNQERYRTVQ